jgi:hypothetical protein
VGYHQEASANAGAAVIGALADLRYRSATRAPVSV